MPAKAKPRLPLTEVMALLEEAGTAQARKTYARHGAKEPMFGVSFATLKTLMKRIGVDHELALALWNTGNVDAQNLAVKIADPALLTKKDLDQWARETGMRMCNPYVAHLAVEGPHARALAETWLGAKSEQLRCVGWSTVGAMATRDEGAPDAWFAERLAQIGKTIKAAPNWERESMNAAVISIGCRSPGLRKSASALAGKYGDLAIDHGDTSCETADAIVHIDKAWTHSTSKGYASPAEHERDRESMRTRC